MNIVTIDVGTSGMRLSIYDEYGSKLHSVLNQYKPKYFGEGYVEQDPEDWKDTLLKGLKDIGIFAKENKIDLSALSITSQRSSLIAMSEEGKPLRNAIMWQDKRSIPQCDNLIEEVGLEKLYLKTGLRINPYFVLPKILWLYENEREVFNESKKFIGVQDYINYLLTGEYATDYSQACRTLFMDIENFKWDEELLGLANIDEDHLPKLLPPGSVGGYLRQDLASKLYLPEKLPVILAGGDQQTAALGMGILKEGMAEANTGTGSFVISASNKPRFDSKERILCQASAIPNKWILEAGIFNTGAIYQWFFDSFYDGENKDFNSINNEALNSRAGSNGVVLIPHFEGSAAPYWNPIAKGMFFNLSLATKRGDLSRAILEGIALEIEENLDLMESMIGEINSVSVAGGSNKSDLFCQIQSSVFNKKVVRNIDNEASSKGAAISCFVSLARFKSYEEAYEKLVEDDFDRFTPDENESEIYKKVSIRKKALYKALYQGDIYKNYIEVI